MKSMPVTLTDTDKYGSLLDMAALSSPAGQGTPQAADSQEKLSGVIQYIIINLISGKEKNPGWKLEMPWGWKWISSSRLPHQKRVR